MKTQQSFADYMASYRIETHKPGPAYAKYPPRLCHRCKQHKTIIGSAKINGHHTCADCQKNNRQN